MKIPQLIEYLQQGREIEFSFESTLFFMSSDWGNEKQLGEYYIFSNEMNKVVAAGTIDELLSFEFRTGVSLQKNIDQFSFEYIL